MLSSHILFHSLISCPSVCMCESETTVLTVGMFLFVHQKRVLVFINDQVVRGPLAPRDVSKKREQTAVPRHFFSNWRMEGEAGKRGRSVLINQEGSTQPPLHGRRCSFYMLRKTTAWAAEEELMNKESVHVWLLSPPRVCVHAQTHATSRAHPSDRQQACVCIVCLWNINEPNTHRLVHARASEVRE